MYEKDTDHEAAETARQWRGLAFFLFSTNFSSSFPSLSFILLTHTDIVMFLGWYYYRQRNDWDTPAVLSMLYDVYIKLDN